MAALVVEVAVLTLVLALLLAALASLGRALRAVLPAKTAAAVAAVLVLSGRAVHPHLLGAPAVSACSRLLREHPPITLVAAGAVTTGAQAALAAAAQVAFTRLRPELLALRAQQEQLIRAAAAAQARSRIAAAMNALRAVLVVPAW